jgi:hypothetical protein
MEEKKTITGLLRGMLAQYLKEAYIYLSDPKKLSRLLTEVKVYSKKNKNSVKSFLDDILLLWAMLNAWFKGEY